MPKNKEPKETFFDHSLNFFKKRNMKPDEATRKIIAGSADPYGHVGTGKSAALDVPKNNYAQNPAEVAVEDDTVRHEPQKTISHGDPLAEAYAMIRKHGGVRFGAQRADGSWEVFPPDPVEQQLGVAEGSNPAKAKGKKSNLIPQTLDPEAQALLAEQLQKILGKA